MNQKDIAKAWKDPEDPERNVAPAHPAGSADLTDAFGGLDPYLLAPSHKLFTAGCCGNSGAFLC